MHSLPEIVRRQLAPTLVMLEKLIDGCTNTPWPQEKIGPREHVYHAMVGMDIWLHRDPGTYPFSEIVDDDAAQMKGTASDRIDGPFLSDFLLRLKQKVASLPDQPDDFLAPMTLRGKELTLLDRCLSQLRHLQHHIGAANVLTARAGGAPASWTGYAD